MLRMEDSAQQLFAVASYFDALGATLDRLPDLRNAGWVDRQNDLLEIAE